MARPAKQGRRQRRWLSVFNNSAVQTMFIVVSAEVIFRVLSVRSPMGEPWFLDSSVEHCFLILREDEWARLPPLHAETRQPPRRTTALQRK